MRKVTKLWTQKNGEKIRICDMSDKHLLNTIKLLERSAQDRLLEIPMPLLNGEMAQFCVEQEYDHLMIASIETLAVTFYPIYDDLLEEKYRRNL